MRGPWPVAIGLALVLGGCTTDVPLGQLPLDASARDASADASTTIDARAENRDAAFDAGELDSGVVDDATVRADGGVVSYLMTFSATATVACYDALAGFESEFVDLAPADVGAYDGVVQIEFAPREDGPHRISGHSLSISFGRVGITVTRPPGSDVPPGICLSETLTASGNAGPHGTTLDIFGLGIDMSTRTPYGLLGFLVVVFDLPDFSGSCEVPFNIDFTIP